MRLIISCLLLVSFPAFNQITLSVGDFADGGDTVRITNAQIDPTIDFSSTGANYNWDFSGLVPASQELRNYDDLSSATFLIDFTYGAFAPSKYQATNALPNNDLPLDQLTGFLPISITEVKQYSKNSVDSITSIGLSMNIEGNEVPVKSDTIETRYKFPLNYLDSYQSRGYTNLDMNPFYNGMWIQYRQRSSIVDGWGSITTPYGTFDVLRVNHAISEIDSLFMEVFGNPTWIELPVPNSAIYEWIAIGEKEPILRITTNEVLGTETVTKIEYRDVYLGLDAGLKELETNYVVYPNPASDVLHIEGLESSFVYHIYNVNGAEVLSGEFTGDSSIDIKELESGNYILYLSDGEYKSVRSIIKD